MDRWRGAGEKQEKTRKKKTKNKEMGFYDISIIILYQV